MAGLLDRLVGSKLQGALNQASLLATLADNWSLDLIKSTLANNCEFDVSLSNDIITAHIRVHDSDGQAVIIDDVESEGLVPNGISSTINMSPCAESLVSALQNTVWILLAEPILVLQILSELHRAMYLSCFKRHDCNSQTDRSRV